MTISLSAIAVAFACLLMAVSAVAGDRRQDKPPCGANAKRDKAKAGPDRIA